MGWNDIKLDKADIAFSRFIRLRDKKCVCCGKEGYATKDGEMIKGLQASHFYSRRKESVRYDSENVDALCNYCHAKRWHGGNRNIDYAEFKLKQLGQVKFDNLLVRSNSYAKRDRNMALIVAKELLKTLE